MVWVSRKASARLYRNGNCVSHCNRPGFQGTLLDLLLSSCSANFVKKPGRKFGVAGSRLMRSSMIHFAKMFQSCFTFRGNSVWIPSHESAMGWGKGLARASRKSCYHTTLLSKTPKICFSPQNKNNTLAGQKLCLLSRPTAKPFPPRILLSTWFWLNSTPEKLFSLLNLKRGDNWPCTPATQNGHDKSIRYRPSHDSNLQQAQTFFLLKYSRN